MTKSKKYEVVEASTPANPDHDEQVINSLGAFDKYMDAIKKVESMYQQQPFGYHRGVEPWAYYIREIEYEVRGEEEIAAFSKIMQRKLNENGHKSSWKNSDTGTLLRRLREEVTELDVALDKYFYGDEDGDEAVLECADVANFAMMIADNVGGLDED